MTGIRQAWLVLNSYCNNNCIWCYAQPIVKNKSHIGVDSFTIILDFLTSIKCNRLIFLGGEPTLHPDFIKLVEIAYSKDFKISIVTNGIKFNEDEYISKLLPFANGISIGISIESHDEKTHDLITRNKGSYQKTLTAIKKCKLNGFKVSTNTTICSDNYKNLKETLSFLKSLGLTKVSLNLGLPPINFPFDEKLFLSINEFANSIESALNEFNYSHFQILVSTPLPLCIYTSEFLNVINSEDSNIFNSYCHMFNGSGIVIDFNGNILPCTHLTNISHGNIFDFKNTQDFEHFWKLKLEETFRKKIRKYPLEDCNKCNLKNQCTGGCPILWTYIDEKVLYEKTF